MNRGEFLFKKLWPELELEEWQRPIINDVVKFLEDPAPHSSLFISILGANGTGKTALLTWIMIMSTLVLHSRKIRFKGSVYSGKFDQLKTTVMRELFEWAGCSTAADLFDVQAHRFGIKGTQSFIDAKASNIQDLHKSAGQHAPCSMIFMDEGSAIFEALFAKLNGSMTDPKTLFVITSNSNRNHGFIYDMFMSPNPYPWRTYVIAHTDLTFMRNKNFEERTKLTYGEDSDTYRQQVLSKFPLFNSDSFISRMYIDAAIARPAIKSNLYPTLMGADVGSGEGVDPSAIVVVKGPQILYFEERKCLYREMEQWLIQMCDRWNLEGFALDEVGVGSGIYQDMREVYDITRITQPVIDKGRFYNKRAEMYSMLRDWIVNVASFGSLKGHKDFDTLVDELLSIEKTYDNTRNLLALVPKRLMQKSPNIADALASTFLIQHPNRRRDFIMAKAGRGRPRIRIMR